MSSFRSFTMPPARHMMPLAAEKLIIPHAGQQQLETSYGQKSREIQSLQTRTEKSRRQKSGQKEVTLPVIVSPA